MQRPLICLGLRHRPLAAHTQHEGYPHFTYKSTSRSTLNASPHTSSIAPPHYLHPHRRSYYFLFDPCNKLPTDIHKMLTSTFFVVVLPTFATAIPLLNTIIPRAGGPIGKPIPSTCTVINPIPSLSPGQGALPLESTGSTLFFSAYYPSPSDNITAMAEQCFQQCYGYGDSTECKTAFWAENVVVPAGYYGGPGGDLMTACLFFNATLTSADFGITDGDLGTTPAAADIQC